MTTETPDKLRLYRTNHRIQVEPINQYEFACATDHIRVWQMRDGRWRHDGYDIARLLEDQYGGETGRKMRAIERLVGIPDIREDPEGDPTRNGAFG